ncbi:MAG: hypothetical protein KIT84_38855 [Labilithrix sp.]|nr:hypothetical protein [Labilithrix sp.]MCW5817022.1 hypothetical protein [Labilithrix sp.]
MRHPLIALSFALTSFAWLACARDYETDAPPATAPDATAAAAGERGGPCYPNATCNAPLSCIDSLCVLLGDGDGGGDPKDAGGDAPSVCQPPPLPVNDRGIQCGPDGETCDAEAICCGEEHEGSTIDWQCKQATALNCVDATTIECDSPSDCGGDEDISSCCVQTVPTAEDACTIHALKSSRCQSQCTGPRACTRNEDCTGAGTCVAVIARLAGSERTIALGLCTPR